MQGVASLQRHQNFIVQAESLGDATGCLAQLFDSPLFRSRMGLYAIDEVHNVDRWGRSHYGVPAFRPAWSNLGSQRTRLFNKPRTLALTATAPPPMIPIIIESLHLPRLRGSPLSRGNAELEETSECS